MQVGEVGGRGCSTRPRVQVGEVGGRGCSTRPRVQVGSRSERPCMPPDGLSKERRGRQRPHERGDQGGQQTTRAYRLA